ncbi:hypothetical protein [Dysgonomonas sp. PH5-37]|uniref:hypothetical protein n=1 Tax=Dysgonomonas sp. PH5-37 TaxID=2940648 RepID=UPI0024764AEB|nr:hypothetical protein [Dysgonomonas sp. PH5-37]
MLKPSERADEIRILFKEVATGTKSVKQAPLKEMGVFTAIIIVVTQAILHLEQMKHITSL